jgi:hypothetical protein
VYEKAYRGQHLDLIHQKKKLTDLSFVGGKKMASFARRYLDIHVTSAQSELDYSVPPSNLMSKMCRDFP